MSNYPAGIDLISAGKCPRGAVSPMACMICPTGHMLECHHPMTCEEANCYHLQADQLEGDDSDHYEEGSIQV